MLDRLSDERRAALVAAIPAGRLGNANDVAAAVAYLCSGDACYLTGTVQNVSGGLVLD
jgi:3-oxoacyl-[acyl-carrier protein] reductase